MAKPKQSRWKIDEFKPSDAAPEGDPEHDCSGVTDGNIHPSLQNVGEEI